MRVRPFTGGRITPGRIGGAYTPPPVASGPPAFRSIASANNVLNNVTCAMPTGVASGDILVAHVSEWVDNKAGGFGSAPLGWTARQTSAGNGDNQFRTSVYTKTAGAAEVAFVWTGDPNVQSSTVTVMAVSGATSVDVVGAMTSYGDSSGSYLATSVTTTESTDLLIGMWARSRLSTSSWTAPASMTRRSDHVMNQGGLYWNVSFATQTLSASGATGTRTATTEGSTGNKYATLLAVK